jgi:hypothetical protein
LAETVNGLHKLYRLADPLQGHQKYPIGFDLDDARVFLFYKKENEKFDSVSCIYIIILGKRKQSVKAFGKIRILYREGSIF